MSVNDNLKSVNDIICDTFISLSIEYAKLYRDNPRAWINAFKKYESIQSACGFIVWSYKYRKIYEECESTGKDFSAYASGKVPADKERIFAGVLLILYAIIHNPT